jgi:hypothetical protein
LVSMEFCAIVDALCKNPKGCMLEYLSLQYVNEPDSFDDDTVLGRQLATAFVTLLQLESTLLVD